MDVDEFEIVPMAENLHLSGIRLPRAEEDIITCATCYIPIEGKIMMFITAKGICDHYFCEKCTNKIQEYKDEVHYCPICGLKVERCHENALAMNMRDAKLAAIREFEAKCRELQVNLDNETERFQRIITENDQRQIDLRSSLEMERKSRRNLESKWNELNNLHQQSKSTIQQLEEQMEDIKTSTEQQLSQLNTQKAKLEKMQQAKHLQSEEQLQNFEKKVSKMESTLKHFQAIKLNLERSHQTAMLTLHDREAEVKKIREELSRQKKSGSIVQDSVDDSIFASVSKYIPSIWGSAPSSEQSLVQSLSDFTLQETRGNRKEGRVRRATTSMMLHGESKTVNVALKKVSYNATLLEAPSLASTLGSYFFQAKTPEQLEIESHLTEVERKKVLREAMLLYKLNNPYIVSLHGLIKGTGGVFYLRMPFLEHDLDFAMESPEFSQLYQQEENLKNIIYQILLGVYYLHSANVVHRHLSTANILTEDSAHIMIAGFSYAASLDSRTLNLATIPVQQLHCIAPEILYQTSEKIPVNNWKAIDMWAVGAIFACLLNRAPFFGGSQPQQVLQSIFSVAECNPETPSFLYNYADTFKLQQSTQKYQKSLREFFPREKVSDGAIQFLSSLLVFDPQQRCTVQQAIEHPYFKNLVSKEIPASCTIGYELADEEIPAFYRECCASLF